MRYRITLTPKMKEIIEKTLSYHLTFRHILEMLVDQGVDDIELQIFDRMKEQVERILKEYGG